MLIDFVTSQQKSNKRKHNGSKIILRNIHCNLKEKYIDKVRTHLARLALYIMGPKNTLFTKNYCSLWTLDNAVREVVQNTIDGAVEWLDSSPEWEGERKDKTDICPGGKGWYVSKSKPPKAFQDFGYEFLYQCELILTVTNEDRWECPKKMKDWHENSNDVAYFLMRLVAREEADMDDLTKFGRQPHKTLLIHFEAVNRILPEKFKMSHITTIGKTKKKNKKHQAGQFGEGFKVGALAAARCGFRVDVQAKGKKIVFVIKKGYFCFNNLNSSFSKAAKSNPNLIYIRLKLQKPSERLMLHRFDPRYFRVISPGVPFNEKGDILTNADNTGEVYNMGIFIMTRSTMLLGYDIADKTILACRDRSNVDNDRLRHCIGEMLLKDESEKLLPKVLELLLSVETEAELRALDEVQVAFRNQELAHKLSSCFRIKEGDHIFPCRKDEVADLRRNFVNRQPKVLLSSMVNLLCEGCYKSVKDNLADLFSDKKQVEVPEKSESIIQSALFRLSLVKEGRVSRDDLVFIDGSECLILCRKNDDKFYLNDKTLQVDENFSCLRASNRLGHCIVTELSKGDKSDLGFVYSELNNSNTPFYTMEVDIVSSKMIKVKLCSRILEEQPQIRVQRATGRQENKTIEMFHAHGKITEISIDLDLDIEYLFKAVTTENVEIIDPLTRECCQVSKKRTETVIDVDDDGDGDDVAADAMELNDAADTRTCNVRSGDTTIQDGKDGIDLKIMTMIVVGMSTTKTIYLKVN